MIDTNTAISLLILLISLSIVFNRRKKSNLPLPPGPKKLPVVGNLFQLPTSFEWETYQKWSEDYDSDIIHLDAAGTSIVIVNSHRAATELFDKRSAIYSSRIQSVMIHELGGWGNLFGFLPYGEAWKERRKLFQQHFHPNDAKIHQPRELEQTHKMLCRLLDSPENFMDHIRLLAGAITISLAYGFDIEDIDDPYLKVAERALVGLAALASPGAFLVDSIPLLKYVPAWMPGTAWKAKAKSWNLWATAMMSMPFLATKKHMAEGTAKPSFVTLCLSNLDENKDIEHQHQVIRDTAGNFFVGGADTTVSAINTFILAMTCYPEIQRKAQEELDRAIPTGQLPEFDDEPTLPYIAAIVKEVLRWRTITPLAIPHYVTEDDEYHGFYIPKGSIVAGNAWAMTHDKNEYPEPFEFRPERFLRNGKLNPDVKDPSAAFGFGRRVCPGKHIAISTLWIAVASILSVYDITPEKDADGVPISPPQEYISSMILHPAPFKCTIKPRSRETEQLILSLDTAAS